MAPREWDASGRLKIERAKEHIRDLESRIAAFRELSPYHVIRDHSFEAQRPGENVVQFIVRVIHDLPPEFALITADAIHNLHVALDHLWQRARHGPRSARHDYFPARESPESARARFHGKEQGRMKVAVDLLYSLNAFEVGNPFYAIRQFDDADKHDTLRLVATALSEWKAEFFDDTGFPRFTLDTKGLNDLSWTPIEDGAVLYTTRRDRVGPKTNVQHDLTFEVTFGEGEVWERRKVLTALNGLTSAVEGLADAFIAAKLLT